MNPERFQSETGQSIEDSRCFFVSNSSPLFYTVNPRSGISLRQQEQLGAPSILKSFRDLPGCTRLSSSLSNLDSKRTQLPLLPDFYQKGTMGKSLPGHHSSKRYVRERYSNPPFKVNAKIKHVYTQEVTTIENQDQNHYQHHRHRHSPESQVVTCHRQTQTEPSFFPESKQKVGKAEMEGKQEVDEVEEEEEKLQKVSHANSQEEAVPRADASTSPIPPPLPDSLSTTGGVSPFSGCSQMTVYPPLNYVKKLEDLEKITGHIVIQRFFTRTDDAFGTWLERQLGMTSKSVSVDTSEFENAKTAELNDAVDAADANPNEVELNNEFSEETDAIVIEGGDDNDDKSDIEPVQEGIISGAISNPGDGNPQETENLQRVETPIADAECAFADQVKCECYLEDLERSEEFELLKEIEDQIIAEEITQDTTEPPEIISNEDAVETLMSSATTDFTPFDSESIPPEDSSKVEDIDEVVRCTLEAYLAAPFSFEESEDHVGSIDDENLKTGRDGGSPTSLVKSEIDSGRADSIQSSQEKPSGDGMDDVEGNTSHDSVETVYEMPIPSTSSKELLMQQTEDELPKTGDNDIDEHAARLQRSLSADSCIGTESSGETKNLHNESQSSNEIEGLETILDPSAATESCNELKELVDISLGSAIPAPLTRRMSMIKPLPLGRRQSARSQRSLAFEEQGRAPSISSSHGGREDKTDAEDADASESESEISRRSDHFLTKSKNVGMLKQEDYSKVGTDLELEEVEEYGDEGEEDERDAFDAMIANHLKYSRGLHSANRRSRLNRGTQTTKSIEPSTSGSLSSCSSSNSSFDVEIISKSKRITTAGSSEGGDHQQHVHKHHESDILTPSNLTMAWHEGGRRRSYLPSSSSSLNLLNMKFSLGKEFESEVSIRMPTKSSANVTPSSILPPHGSGIGGKSLMSSSRTHHHFHQANRGVSSSSHHSQPHHVYTQHQGQSPPSALHPGEPTTELQSLWKDVRNKLDVHVDEIMTTTLPEEESLHVRGNGIGQVESNISTPHTSQPNSSRTAVSKLKKNEERIKRSLQRLQKILDD
ncbi:unnamed protein product [Orchesella dallaii]|uniref:Uncharacterized protein n=1 Tax=Orchesella dallaii TaxID=48710 RepID=A0ABP1PVS9_9HEXA